MCEMMGEGEHRWRKMDRVEKGRHAGMSGFLWGWLVWDEE